MHAEADDSHDAADEVQAACHEDVQGCVLGLI